MEETENRIMCFGGQLRENGKAVDDIVAGAFAQGKTVSRIVEVTALNEVVYEVTGAPSDIDISVKLISQNAYHFMWIAHMTIIYAK